MRRSVTAALVGGLLALLAGCVAGEESESASQDITGGVAQARACAVQAAYLDAPLGAFTSVAFDRLPGLVRARATKTWGENPFESTSAFTVKDVGQVYVLEQTTANGSVLDFYGANSDALATATTQGSWLTFRLPYAPPSGGLDGGGGSSSAPLQCSFRGDGGGIPWDAASDGGRDASSPRDAGYDARPTYRDASDDGG